MKFLRPSDVEAEYGLKKETLKYWRSKEIGPPFFRVSPGLVLYDAKKLEGWLRQFEVQTNTTTTSL